MQKIQKMQDNQEQIDPNDPFGIGLVPYHPDLITFTFTGEENLLLDFEDPKEIPESKNKYVASCCFYNESNPDDGDDEESFFEFLSDDDVEYECYNCKRAKYEDEKRRRGEEVKRKRRR
ncbi:hypothetical protein Glove_114g194 [Diversispora epigaea]|uniref:Uncharacterized protein n=1 Tax=Diversispora epigaea TaxID=1348612 RepID=A0A397J1C1_9GLOM|nr:hypothetical protein Glove_114g194 [Diversispora epigaea]